MIVIVRNLIAIVQITTILCLYIWKFYDVARPQVSLRFLDQELLRYRYSLLLLLARHFLRFKSDLFFKSDQIKSKSNHSTC